MKVGGWVGIGGGGTASLRRRRAPVVVVVVVVVVTAATAVGCKLSEVLVLNQSVGPCMRQRPEQRPLVS
jgi:hypothetical protein